MADDLVKILTKDLGHMVFRWSWRGGGGSIIANGVLDCLG